MLCTNDVDASHGDPLLTYVRRSSVQGSVPTSPDEFCSAVAIQHVSTMVPSHLSSWAAAG